MALIKASRTIEEKWCALIWASLHFVMGLLSLQKLVPNLVLSLIAYAVAYIFFWLLRREDDLSVKWVVIVAVGAAVLLYI